MHGQWQSAIPSRFVDELPLEHVEVRSDSGLYGGNADAGLRENSSSGFAGYGHQNRNWRATPSRGEGERARTNWGRTGGAAIPQPRARRGTLIEGSAETVATRKAPKFAVGARVFHDKFGYGTVSAVEGDKLTIDFEHTGEKKVMEGFVSEGK